MKINDNQIEEMTKLFKDVLKQEEDGFIYEWIESGIRKTVMINIKRKEDNPFYNLCR